MLAYLCKCTFAFQSNCFIKKHFTNSLLVFAKWEIVHVCAWYMLGFSWNSPFIRWPYGRARQIFVAYNINGLVHIRSFPQWLSVVEEVHQDFSFHHGIEFLNKIPILTHLPFTKNDVTTSSRLTFLLIKHPDKMWIVTDL